MSNFLPATTTLVAVGLSFLGGSSIPALPASGSIPAAEQAASTDTETFWAGASRTVDDVIVIGGAREAPTEPDESPSSADPIPDPYVYERRGPCYQPDWTPGAVPVCAGSDVLPPAPDCGTEAMVLPLWRQPADDPTADWELVQPWHCPTEPAPVLSATAFRELPLAPAPALIQPAAGDILVNAPTILYTDATVQNFTTTLLGQQIQVRAVPATFTWAFADDTEPLVTTEPGRPYPAKDLTHVYTATGDYSITLTTTWTGTYRLTGTTTWYPVTGTATTVSTTRTFTAHELHTHLVASP